MPFSIRPMWELCGSKTRGTKESYSFLSIKKRNEYGCGEKRLRTLAVMHCSGSYEKRYGGL